MKNNKTKLKIETEGKIGELNEYHYNYEIKNVEISLIGIENVTDISYMFAGCSSLFDISKFDTSNVKNMENMFAECSSLKILPDISN